MRLQMSLPIGAVRDEFKLGCDAFRAAAGKDGRASRRMGGLLPILEDVLLAGCCMC